MKNTLHFLFLWSVTIFISASAKSQNDRFAYAITDLTKEGGNWCFLRKVDLQTGTYGKVLINGNSLNQFGNSANTSLCTGIAAIANDKKNGRLYFTPMQTDRLSYVDLKTMNVYVVTKEFTGLIPKAADQGNVITRMTIADDEKGYALTNDGRHLIRFTTDKKSIVTDLGSLVDAVGNKTVSVHTACSSFGGDLVADDEGNLYLFSAYNNVFKIKIKTKVATYLGVVTGLPADFTANGVAVNQKNQIVITSAARASDIYAVDINTLSAKGIKVNEPWRTSDLANGNILGSKKQKLPDLIVGSNIVDDNEIQLFPNPVTTNQFNIEFKNTEAGAYTIEVINANGQLTTQKVISVGGKGNIVTVYLKELSAKGIYIVKVYNSNRRTVFSNKVLLQ